MKRILLLLLFISFNRIAYCQSSTLYLCDDMLNKGFMCFTDDTLSFYSITGGYFYGSYALQDSVFIPKENLLEDKSCTIIEEPCDSSCMEIAMSFWEHPWFTPFEEDYESKLFIDSAWRIIVFYDSIQSRASEKSGIVSFCNDELDMLGDSLTFRLYIDGYEIRTKATIPIKAGVRFRLMQKHYKMYPYFTPNREAPSFTPLVYYKNNKQQIVFYYGESFSLIYNRVDENCSCLEELRKRFPDL